MRLVLPKPVRLSRAFNNAPNHKGRIKSREYKEWQQHAMQEMMIQRIGQPLPHPPVELTIQVPSTKGRGDVCNCEKVVTDTLVLMGVIPDDNDRILPRVTIEATAPEDQCIVILKPYEVRA